MRKGFIYRIDYVGEHPLIKGCSYAGSKKESQAHRWSKYFGSPSKQGCEKCAAWVLESKINPHLFNKTIVREVEQDESIVECEIEYLKSVSKDINTDAKWLNSAIPRLGSFPEFSFTPEQMEEREAKRKHTMLNNTGFEHNFQNTQKMKESVLKKYGVENVNQLTEYRQRNSKHKKMYFASMTSEERKLHGKKSLQGRDAVNVMLGAKKQKLTKQAWSSEYKKQLEENRRAKWQLSIDCHTPEKRKEISNVCKYASTMLRKQYYITIEFIDEDKIESKFLNEWLQEGFARDGVMDRIKKCSAEPLFSRKLKKWVRIVSFTKKRLSDTF